MCDEKNPFLAKNHVIMCVNDPKEMASHFKWYPASEEIVVPWNARYAFPSQANKAVKMTPRIPPKSGQVFAPGNIIRIEFPAQGYVNPLNTTLEFDVAILQPTAAADTRYSLRFQNNIQSIFQRVRLLYGATPIEDILNYNVIVRALTEWTSTNQAGTMDQTSISEGIGGYVDGTDQGPATVYQGRVNTRQKYIHGIEVSNASGTGIGTANLTGGGVAGLVPNSDVAGIQGLAQGTVGCTRRYQINFALGLFTQDKLIPVKFMASQLAIEITLEAVAACMICTVGAGSLTTLPDYRVGNINLIPEILEFDSSYDAMFLRGLREGGVPIKFSSWHTFFFNSARSSNINLQVQERSRSVKALFAVQRLPQPNLFRDNGALLFDTASATEGSTLQQYQFRIGGRYFPASPVQTSFSTGAAVSNGGAEAFVELQKALNCVGDYRLSTSCNTIRWAVGTTPAANDEAGLRGVANWFDHAVQIYDYDATGRPLMKSSISSTNSFVATTGSMCFAMAIDLETSNGMEISGLNAEEQSDIALLAQWSASQQTGADATASSLEVYSFYDAMIVLRENNVLELIQ
jgi:hypothetical protein